MDEHVPHARLVSGHEPSPQTKACQSASNKDGTYGERPETATTVVGAGEQQQQRPQQTTTELARRPQEGRHGHGMLVLSDAPTRPNCTQHPHLQAAMHSAFAGYWLAVRPLLDMTVAEQTCK